MVTAVDTEKELGVEPPEYVRYGDERVRVGGTVFRALRHMLARSRGADLDGFTKAVWGRTDVQGETIRSLIWRTNGILRGLQCKRRLMLSGDKVLFE